MPIYEYRCQKNGHVYEKREGFDAPATQKCPTCRSKALRVIQAAPIVFKGSGFYKTDSRASAPTDESSKNGESSSASKDGESSSDKSDGASSASKDSKSGSDKSNGSSSTKKAAAGEAATSS